MDDLTSIALMMQEQNMLLLFVFYCYVLIAALTLMNMLIGVLCEVVSAVASTEKEASAIDYVKEILHDILTSTDLDSNCDGAISKEEFMALFHNKQATSALTDVGVDVVGLLEFADFLFCGDNDEEIQLQPEEMVKVILDLRGSNVTTVRDIVDLRKFFKAQLKETEEMFRRNLRSQGEEPVSCSRKSVFNATGDADSHSFGTKESVWHAESSRLCSKDTNESCDKLSLPAGAAPQPEKSLGLYPPLPKQAASNGTASLKQLEVDVAILRDQSRNSNELDLKSPSLQSLRGLANPESEKDGRLPSAGNFSQLTEQLVSGLQSVKQLDQSFAELRAENRRLMEQLSAYQLGSIRPTRTSEYSIPGVPNHGDDDSPHPPRPAREGVWSADPGSSAKNN